MATRITLAEARDLINKALTPIGKGWYTIDVVFNRDIEHIRVHKDSVECIVQDLLCGHPQCPLYAQSKRRLRKEEQSTKYDSIDRERYESLKWEMLELYLPPDPSIYQKFKDMGFNPTGGIDHDNKTRFHLNNLLRKQWRSKRDSDAGKTRDIVIAEMYQALRENPKEAFISNRYLPSIIDAYRE